MTNKIRQEAERNGFEEKVMANATIGKKSYLVKGNVEIFVESWSNCEGWFRRPEADVLADISNYGTLKRQADEMDAYRAEIEREVYGC